MALVQTFDLGIHAFWIVCQFGMLAYITFLSRVAILPIWDWHVLTLACFDFWHFGIIALGHSMILLFCHCVILPFGNFVMKASQTFSPVCVFALSAILTSCHFCIFVVFAFCSCCHFCISTTVSCSDSAISQMFKFQFSFYWQCWCFAILKFAI